MYRRHESHGLGARSWAVLSLLLASTAALLGGAAEAYAADHAPLRYPAAGEAAGYVVSEGVGVDRHAIDPVNQKLDAATFSSAVEEFPFIMVPVNGSFHQTEASGILLDVNAERVRLGRPELVWDGYLEETAMQRAVEISILFSHTRTDGSSCSTIFPEDLHAMGENIASGPHTAMEAYRQWANSPGHYANMINPMFTKIGVAYFENQYGTSFWVMCLGAGGETNEDPSHLNGPAEAYVPISDQLVTSVTPSTTELTPGVDSLRALPSVRVAFDGVVDGTRLYGSVDYSSDWFDWTTDDDRVATVERSGGSTYCKGVAAGSTTLRGTHLASPKINQAIQVRVTQDGAFVDVDASTPHRDAVLYLSSTGVTAGYPDGSFKPYVNVARADMAAFLRRYAVALGVSDAGTWRPGDGDRARFSDVDEGTAHAEDILWLAHAGISTGFEDGGFHPYASIARCDMAAFLRRFCALAGVEGSSGGLPGQGGIASFPDVASDTPHRDDVLWLARAGITTGFPDGTFKPYGIVARCDMAAFLERIAVIVN